MYRPQLWQAVITLNINYTTDLDFQGHNYRDGTVDQENFS